jgi:hypothetical protein
MSKKTKKENLQKKSKTETSLSLFIKLSKCDKTTYISRFVAIEEFIEEFSDLTLGNGGGWCRFDVLGKKYKIVTRNASGEFRHSWDDVSDVEKTDIENEFPKNYKSGKKGNKITHIKLHGKKEEGNSRYIRPDIRKHFEGNKCVVCGNSEVEIDHKNGLYNDPRVLDSKTQTIDDFQVLCRHCNLQKRQSIVETKESGKRYPATRIPQLSVFGIDFIQGSEEYDKNDKDTMKGTYWYDPVEFMKKMIELKIDLEKEKNKKKVEKVKKKNK